MERQPGRVNAGLTPTPDVCGLPIYSWVCRAMTRRAQAARLDASRGNKRGQLDIIQPG